MKALLTVVMENFVEVRAALQSAGRPPPGRIGAPDPVPEALVERMGGRLLAVDLSRGVVLGERPLPTPSGLCWPDPAGPIWVASMWGDTLLAVNPETGRPDRAVSHPAFNDLHTVVPSGVPSGGRLLVACSGVDAVVELHPDEAPLGAWVGWAPPWPTPIPNPDRADPSADHRGRRYATLGRALHINSALPWGDGVLLSSFHTGELLELGRHDGALTRRRAGLDHPHALTLAGAEGGLPPGSLVLCESPRGAVRVLHADDLSDHATFSPGLRWVQAACPSGRGTLLLLDNPHFGAGRRGAGPARVLELDPTSGRCATRLELPAGWRLFSLTPLTDAQTSRIGWLP
ncbi:MAG: hypothetical protein RIT28_2278 [Pseudomonadota bacterium]